MGSLRLRAQIYLVLLCTVAAASAAALLAIGREAAPRDYLLGMLFSLLLAAALRTPLPFGPNAHLLLDTAVILSAVLVVPPGVAVAVAATGPLLANIPRRAGWEEAAFGSAQTALQAAGAVVVLAATGWWDYDSPFDTALFLPAVLAAGITVHVINTLAVAGILSFEGGEPAWRAWRRILVPDRTEAAGYVAQWGIGLLAAVVSDAHAWALVLLVLPGAVVLGSLDRHVRLRIAAEQQLIDQAHHDPLTGLLNRGRFTERLEAVLEDSPDGKALLFLDLDRFKLVNDTYGHEAGDHLLVEVARRLERSIGPDDLAARLGGDEFVALVDDSDQRATAIAGRIAVEMAAPVWLDTRHVEVTASIGIASTTPGMRADDLLRNADVALYQAKDGGRNRATVFDAALGAAMRERAAIRQALQAALENDGLWLAYQPQVDLDTGTVVALEALLRWDDRERGMMRPPDFLAIAESTGLIVPLGRWVLTEACRAARRWSAVVPNPPAVAINIGQSQLADASLVPDVLGALAATGLPPSRLRLEIAEGAAMNDATVTVKVLRQLSAIGVHLILDDFGSGTSSLPHLVDFPIETLALDRALTSQVGQSLRSETIVRAVTSAAVELGLTVAAKGIEEFDQEHRLRGLGCTFGQGHWYGEATTEEVALQRLRGRPGTIVHLAEAS